MSKIWLAHDGYRDPDDNLSILVGSALAKALGAKISGVVWGDTLDGGQFHTLFPAGKTPAAFGNDPRFDGVAKNKVAAGNYEFFKDYVSPAIAELSDGSWRQFDLIGEDTTGRRAWNFDARWKADITKAAGELVTDIRNAKDGEIIIYSAAGGANVAAEAVGFLLNNGWTKAQIKEHLVILQHGRSNWENQYEKGAHALTTEFTIAISNQNMTKYANGKPGPGLKDAIVDPDAIDGSGFGPKFDDALQVAIGEKPYAAGKLKAGTTFKSGHDASDAGSHAFAMSDDLVFNAMPWRLAANEFLRNGDDAAHLIFKTGGGSRQREHFNAFDQDSIADLFDSSPYDGIGVNAYELHW